VLINAESKGEDALVSQVALILHSEPRLGAVLKQALDRVSNGTMPPEVFRDLAAYAAYRLSTEEHADPHEDEPIEDETDMDKQFGPVRKG
jgi:hypothetical protein